MVLSRPCRLAECPLVPNRAAQSRTYGVWFFMRGFPVNGDPEPAELSRPPENPPPELGYRCAQGRRLDLVDNCFWYLGDIGALANVRFAPEAAFPFKG